MPTSLYPGQIDEFSLPYVPAASPSDDSHFYIRSGQNAMMNLGGWLSRRPGFIKFASNQIAGTINNISVYRRWSGVSYIMLSVATATDSIVYKLRVGVDSQFSSLFTTVGVTERWDFDISGDILYFCNGTDMKKWDGSTVTNWGIAGGSTAPAASQSAGALTSSQGGWSWAYSFGNSSTGHFGAASPSSKFTGNITSQQFTITGDNSSDPQVDKIHIFRTKDGGSIWYEHPSSPIAYANGWTFTDNSADSTLNLASVAPQFNQNLRPPASKGVIFHAGRLWTFAGSYVYYSLFEENINGVPAESFAIQNRRDFGVEVTKIVRAGKTLLIFTRTSIWRIRGDSLDTFYTDIFLNSFGTPSRPACTNSGKIVGFLETAGNIVATDGLLMLEPFGLPVGPDIDSFSQSSISVVFHRQGRRSWFVIQDASQNKMWLFDVQIGWWNVPWTFGGSAIYSGEISSGAARLLVAKNGYVYYLDPTSTIFADDGIGYSCFIKTGMIGIIPEAQDPDWVGSLEYVTLRTNAIEPSSISYLVDDDPDTSFYTTVPASDKYVRPERTQGTSMLEKNYRVQQSGVDASIRIDWDNAQTEWRLYGGAIAPQAEITGV